MKPNRFCAFFVLLCFCVVVSAQTSEYLGKMVVLRPEDALENYTIEEISGYKFNPIGQGLDIRSGKLYMPTGFGTEEQPSILYVWDLRKKKMTSVDLSKVTTGELEDIALLGSKCLLLQSQVGLFRVKL